MKKKQSPDNQNIVHITREEAMQLIKSGRAKKTSFISSSGFALLMIAVTFFLLVGFTWFYFTYINPIRSVGLLELPPFHFEILRDFDVPEPIINTALITLKEKVYNDLDEQLLTILINYTLPDSINSDLRLYRLYVKYKAGNYEVAIRYANRLQSDFITKSLLLNEILWVKAHLYYESKQYIEALTTFRAVIRNGDNPWVESSLKYEKNLYALTEQYTLFGFFFE